MPAASGQGRWLIYGAYGYSGSRIAARAAEMGHEPVLAGRDGTQLKAVADPLGLEARPFALDDPAAVDAGLNDVDAVLNCAGPFMRTSDQLLDACLRTGTHYLDITGEIGVFERCAELGPAAEEASVVLMPGVGFDLVPGDCLALHLQQMLPDASELEVGFRYDGPMTRGSAKTSLLLFSQGALLRREGRLVPAEGKITRSFDFGEGPRSCPAITFGDLSVSYRSTGIPNVTSYTTFAKAIDVALDLAIRAKHLIARPRVARAGEWLIDKLPPGPNENQLVKYGSVIVAEVRNPFGETRTSRLRLPNVYSLTFDLAPMIAQPVADGDVEPGYRTPGGTFGPDFILSAPGCTREDL